MQTQHFLLIAVAFVLGYALRNVWTWPATTLGLP